MKVLGFLLEVLGFLLEEVLAQVRESVLVKEKQLVVLVQVLALDGLLIPKFQFSGLLEEDQQFF